MATDSGYEKGNYLRVCDICGHRYHFKELTPIGELRFACPDDAPGLTAVQISRFNARARPLVVRPNKWAKDYTQTGIYQLAEAQIFNFIAKVAPARYIDDVSDPFAAAWAAVYMADVIVQNKRPMTWMRTARTALDRCLSYLLANQYGAPNGPAATSDNPRYGGWFTTSSGGFVTQTAIIAGVAFVKAYQATGTQDYLSAADRVAVFLRHMQCGDIQAVEHTTFPSAGGAYHVGGFAITLSNSTGQQNLLYSLGDVSGLWFLQLLGQVRGTSSAYGDAAATAFFTAPTRATIATMISELIAFAEVGAPDLHSNSVVRTGLDPAQPQTVYTAASNLNFALGFWGATTFLTTNVHALALLGLYFVNGNDATVQAMMAMFAACTSNPSNQTPASLPEPDRLAGITGTFDPAIAPATSLLVSPAPGPYKDAAGSVYDWASEGLFSPILSATSSGAFRTSKDAISTARRFSYYDVSNLFIGPIGESGFSFQPRDDSLSSAGDVVRAAQTGMIYRYDPGRYPLARGN